ncbi:ribosome biogenesis GTPase A [Alkalithermobacter thermoalcaliphilus JW-YL-7 = DSM 7308]|uniref:Ribosome biogenesis GTPase A n=1 Tax=Alkalithermobacter thermoalcaliphilus JW-YL-7 = DSM 7308 TaxID=1121328 RepID=A0A150FR07_CLOPD|nr:ribosome biogenesis GTP-binding protein YlqF [[Clostridium] paradoxum JW-YL-7 = DSM 7308]SHL12017.1 ribosome biogenesis GTPase A [[Clostridium] paradoxum JW-YL-7 = DSM 7308]
MKKYNKNKETDQKIQNEDRMHINWFPGHMKKTRDLLKENLKLVDVVVELLDSRIPYSSKNPEIDKIIQSKPRVVVLNKADLADANKLKLWVKYYKDLNTKAICVNTLTGEGINELIEECKNVTKEKMEALIKKGRKERPIRMMIVGIPNVGKSSIINRLTGRKSAQTGDRPGITKGKQWVRLKGNLELLDTPGILWPKFEDERVALNLAFTRAIKDEILDIETLALKLIEKLSDIAPDKLVERYKIELGQTPLETMENIGRKRGCIISKNELDYTRIANIVLNEFREGKIGNITLEVPSDIEKE